jgi:putative membrane protein
MMKGKWIYMLLFAASLTWISCDDDDDDKNNEVKISETDQGFIETAAMNNMAEIRMGELALEKGTDELVREFAQQMISEHTVAQDELKQIFDRYEEDNENLEWPENLNEKNEDLRDDLEDMNGFSFDSMYMATQVAAHQEAENAFETQVNSGQDATTKAYANKYLPKIQMHLERADSIHTVVQENNQNSGNGGGTGDGDGTGTGTGDGTRYR